MRRYLIKRFLRSLLSIFIVMTIVFTLVYSVVPRDRVFFSDVNIEKLQKRPDDYLNYKYIQWEKLGYLKYETIQDYCRGLYGDANGEYVRCLLPDSSETKEFVSSKQEEGWEVSFFEESGQAYSFEEISPLKRALNWWANLIQIDSPNRVKSEEAILKRQIYVGKDFNDRLALMCSGCENKYLIYFDQKFPFIHQNIVKLNLGVSYPTFSGQEVLEVITSSQGEKVKQELKEPINGQEASSINYYTCRYKETLDALEKKNFSDHYADCDAIRTDPSMMKISFIMGFISLVLTYVIGLPLGVYMARHQGRWGDRLGQWYIIFMNAIPGLAYIVFIRFIGGKYFGLPSMFPMLGAEDPRSYILPILSLTLGATASRMMWMRRYMIDQSQMDYVKFARAKGLSEREIFSKHIFRNAIIPMVHGIPAAIIFCISGALITEGVYGIPGMGKILPDSISIYNNSMVVGLTFIFTTLSILSTFLGDWLLTKIDPRIRLEDKGGN